MSAKRHQHCLNGDSEWFQCNLQSTINACVGRNFTHCSSWNTTHKELEHLTQVLLNNGLKNSYDDEIIKKTIRKGIPVNDTHPTREDITTVYYMNHMPSEDEKEENLINNIIKTNVKPRNLNTPSNLSSIKPRKLRNYI